MWFHGTMIIEDGSLQHFRYASQEPTTTGEFVKVIKERFARNSVVLWIDEGFTPKDTSEWDPDIWLLYESDWTQGTLAQGTLAQGTLAVVKG